MMFRLSLCSKELFHSNFLAYLLETKPDLVKIFDKSLQDKVKNVKREWKHTDISFECGNELIVIENKFKSIPNQQQLQDYIDKIRQEEDAEEKEKKKNKKKKKIAENNNNENKPKLSRIILLSYYKPHFNLNSHNKVSIKYLSYEDLYEKLKEIKEKKEQNQYFNDYCDMLKLLLDLKTVLNIKKRKVTYGDMINDINDVQSISQQFNFHVTLQKIFLNELGQELKNDLGDIFDYIHCDYSSGVAYVDLMQSCDCDKRNYKNYKNIGITDIGITITIGDTTCNNIRHYIGIKSKDGRNTREEIEKFLNKTETPITCFFTDCTGQKNNKTRFKGFDNLNKKDKKCWLYKYKDKDLENKFDYSLSSLTYDGLKELVKSEFDNIKKQGE